MVFLSKHLFKHMNEREALMLGALSSPIFGLMHGLTCAVLLLGVKWSLVGRQKPGHAAVWGTRFACRWIVRQCSFFCWNFSIWTWLSLTPSMSLLHQALGCQLGHSVELVGGCIEDYDLVSVGNGAIVDGELNTEYVSLGVQQLAPIAIGDNSSIGSIGFCC